ncbi:MAG: VOC family protein [Frankiaceae bacterium]|nr:VOC family protein [Frankiaceae bacterium]
MTTTAEPTVALDSTPATTPDTGRLQLALNVDDLTEAVAFYTKLFRTPPAKLRPGYANFAVAAPPLKLVLIENPGKGGSINHLGVEVPSSETVHAEIARLTDAGLFTAEELGTTCCFATQDKVWVQSPGGERWEIYTVLADSETFGASPKTAPDSTAAGATDVCCGAATSDGTTAATATATETATSCC